MELNEMIKKLIDSGIVENQTLGVTMLNSDEVPEDVKRKHIEKFISDYTNGKVNFFDEEHQNIFNAWVEVYQKYCILHDVENRVKKIE